MARRRSRSPLKVRLTLPKHEFKKKQGFPPGHFYSFHGNYSTSTVKVGESLDSLFSAPIDVSESEWLAYHLHFLIERTLMLFDYMQFHCSDGITLIQFDSPIDYAVPIDMTRFSDTQKRELHQPTFSCIEVVRVGFQTALEMNDVKMTLEEAEDPPFPYSPLKTVAQPETLQASPGAPTYIKTILTYMKDMRMNTYFFPRKKTEDMNPRAFNRCAAFILYHLINIMSHYVSCHMHQIEKGGIANQVFSLFLSVFVVAERHLLLPPRTSLDEDVFELYRYLKTIDQTIYDNVPDIQSIFKSSIGIGEKKKPKEAAAAGEPQPSSSSRA